MIKSILLAVALSVAGLAVASGQTAPGPKFIHTVFFTLKDKSPVEATRMVGECKKYLSGHPGEISFLAGVRAKEQNRAVNDKEFDIYLQVVFQSKADHDRYQAAERHKQFISVNEAGWANVRVFDSLLPQ